jgi:hypothetical protein
MRALSAGAATARVTLLLLAAFFVALLVLLVSMLATAARTYQGAKAREEAHVLRSYASMILDMEAMVPAEGRRELSGGALGRFVHVLELQPAAGWLLGEMQQRQGGLSGPREAGGCAGRPAQSSEPGAVEHIRGELAAVREQLDDVQRSVQQAVRQALQSQAQQLQASLPGTHAQQTRRRGELTPPQPRPQPGPQEGAHKAARRATSPPASQQAQPIQQQPSSWLLERGGSRRGSSTGGGVERRGVSASVDGLGVARDAGERDASQWLLRRSADS